MRIALVILSYVFAYLFVARPFGNLYTSFFPESISSSFVPSAIGAWIVGLPLAIIFLITFLIHASGKKQAWWWTIIPLLPAVLFELALDILHLYIPIALGLIAWGLGIMANKILHKLVPGFMAKIG